MNVKIKYFFHIVLMMAFFMVGTIGFSQEKAIDKSNWEDATEGVEYNEKPKEPEKKIENVQKRPSNDDAFDWKEFFSSFNLIFKIIGYTALVAVVVFALWKLLPYVDNRNKKISSIQQINADPDQLEDHMKALDFDALVAEAVKNENYTLAIRLYYLHILKRLWDNKFIRWRKQKTNYDYILETSTQPFNEELKLLTRSFERSWYGEKPTYKSTFDNYEAEAKTFLTKING